MTQSWMEEVFHHEEEKLKLQKGNEKGNGAHSSYVHDKNGRILFLAAIASSLAMLLCCIASMKTGGRKGRNEKRKTSEEDVVQLVVSNTSIS